MYCSLKCDTEEQWYSQSVFKKLEKQFTHELFIIQIFAIFYGRDLYHVTFESKTNELITL